MVYDEWAIESVRAPWRRMVALLLSVIVHGGGALIAALAVGHAVATPPRAVELIPIELVVPPAAPSPARAPERAVARISAGGPSGVPGRRTSNAAPHAESHAPPSPFADLAVHIDAPTDPSPGAAGTAGTGRGTGLTGSGLGAGGTGDGVGRLGVPSLARAAAPKHDYRRWNFRTDRRFAGAAVDVELTIDPGGAVRAVRVVHGVNEAIDQHAVETARDFEFYPALDAGGDPTWTHFRWEFLIANP